MLLKPRMFLLVIAAALGWLMAIAGFIIGVAGLLGGRMEFAAAGLGVFAVFWAVKIWAQKNRSVVERFLEGR